MTEDLEDRLRQALESGFRVTRIDVHRGELGRLVMRVVSPDFDGMDDVERQVRAWSLLRSRFSDEELVRLEYLFTEGESDQVE